MSADLVRRVQEDEQTRAQDNQLMKTVSEDIKTSLYGTRWETLLYSAPVSLKSMGMCLISASSETGARIILSPPPGKSFKYLVWPSLQGNLVQCANIGRMTFLHTHNGMTRIAEQASHVDKRVVAIAGALNTIEDAQMTLMDHMRWLDTHANNCLKTCESIDKEFENWLLYVMELHEACVQQSATSADKAAQAALDMKANEAMLKGAQKSEAELKDTQGKFKDALEMTSKEFQRASEDFPSGWELIGQQFVGGLTEAFTGAINAAVPALVARINPIAMIGQTADTVRGAFNGPPSPTNSNGAAQNGSQPSSQGRNPALDMTYADISRHITYIETLGTIVGVSKQGNSPVDWDLAGGEGDKGEKGLGAGSLYTYFSTEARLRAKSTNQTEAAEKLDSIIKASAEIARSIKEEVNNAKNPKYQYPKNDSDVVKEWQSRFRPQYDAAYELYARARSAPGMAPGGIPTSAQALPPTGGKFADMYLNHATNRLNTTQSAFLTTQKNLVEITSLVNEKQNQINEISALLERLRASQMGLRDIILVLQSALQFIIQLKADITNLVAFFKTLSIVIKDVTEIVVSDFIENVAKFSSTNPNSVGDDVLSTTLTIGRVNFTQYQRNLVFAGAVTIRSYFSVYGDVAKMWTKLSGESIMPGLTLVDQMMVWGRTLNMEGATAEATPDTAATELSREEAKQKMVKMAADLKDWSDKAIANVKKIASETYDNTKLRMEDRVQGYVKTSKVLPPSSVKEAIEAGAESRHKDAERIVAKEKNTSVLGPSFGVGEF